MRNAPARARALGGDRHLTPKVRSHSRSREGSGRARTTAPGRDARARADRGARPRRSASARRAFREGGAARPRHRCDPARPRRTGASRSGQWPRARDPRWRAAPHETRGARSVSVGRARGGRPGSGREHGEPHTLRTRRRGHRGSDGLPARARRDPTR